MQEEDTNSNTIDDLESKPSDGLPAEDIDSAELVASKKALADKAEELKALNDKYLRLAAEFDNYKRLAQRDQRDQIKFGNEQLLKELLPVVDNLERAIKAAKDSGVSADNGLMQGIELTFKQFIGALGKFGVQAIPTVGQPFDPASHQAVASMPSDEVPDQHVIEEFQRGYRLHDRILRAAMVTVSSGASSTPN
ncbi:nucleotide exchange factor GrpE [Petrachloros mirabilis]